MFRSLIIVGAGGAGGSMARFAISYAASRYITSLFPFATFSINVVGAFIIGLLSGLGIRYNWLHGQQTGWLLLATGFCGGFTTFSTFAYENVSLMLKGEFLSPILYTSLSIIVGFLLCFAGMKLARLF